MTTKMAKIAVLRAEDGSTRRYPVPRGFRPKADGYELDGKRWEVVAVLRADDGAVSRQELSA